MKLSLIGIIAISSLAFFWLTLGQTPQVGGQDVGKKDADKKEKEAQKKDLKDPTEPSPKLKEILNPAKVGKGAPNAKLPTITLRGRVISKDGAAALLEVDGRMVTVTKGTSVTMPGGGTLTIVELNGQEVRIEALPSKESIILR